MLPSFQPMLLQQRRSAFDHPDWIFELKYDGFRAMAYIDAGECRLISRNGNQFKSFPALNRALALEFKAKSAVLDGEIVCFDKHGCSQFENLLFRRGEPRFIAFDCLYRDGVNFRYLPLSERKHHLRGVIPESRESLLYCDHVEGVGEALFRFACERDLSC